MELRYGQAIQLKKDIDLSFYCDGILPAGQMGYQETHYKIKFDQATLIMPASLVSELFEEYKNDGQEVVEQVEELIEEVKEFVEDVESVNNESDTIADLTKLKKDDLIELVKTAFPDRDYSGLKKDELIQILEGPTDA